MLITRRFQPLVASFTRFLAQPSNAGITSQSTPSPTAHQAAVPKPNDASATVVPVPAHMDLHRSWPAADQSQLLSDMLVLDDFLSAAEEEALFAEVDPYMQRLRYEFDHWDDAIHGFRETERQHWYPDNKTVLQRVADAAFDGNVMPYIHVLDLAESGVIKAHVDSSRYCGSTIAGLSLMSDCVMRLVRTDEQRYKQTKEGGEVEADEYRSLSKESMADRPDGTLDTRHYADVLLKRRSLYIMKDSARYHFTHEILGNERSLFKGSLVPKTRRISVICRNKP